MTAATAGGTAAYDVVALDLDGTTVRSDGAIGERTRAALRRVELAGATVIVVTGRPPRWMPPVLDALGPQGLAICANGAVVIDIATGDVVEERPLSAEVIRALIRELSAEMPQLYFAVERADSDGFAHEPDYRPRWSTADMIVLESRDELSARPATKLLARHEGLDPDALLAAARTVIGSDIATLTHSSRDGLLEISAAGVSKATTLADLCERRGVRPERVIAFGDMPNDVPMLRWAGHAVAVGNAHPDVLQVADEVTASNDDDGVARVLDRLWPPR
jgi:Cof subfamily protein (haloacid dehalogenase superfamily)